MNDSSRIVCYVEGKKTKNCIPCWTVMVVTVKPPSNKADATGRYCEFLVGHRTCQYQWKLALQVILKELATTFSDFMTSEVFFN